MFETANGASEDDVEDEATQDEEETHGEAVGGIGISTVEGVVEDSNDVDHHARGPLPGEHQKIETRSGKHLGHSIRMSQEVAVADAMIEDDHLHLARHLLQDHNRNPALHLAEDLAQHLDHAHHPLDGDQGRL